MLYVCIKNSVLPLLFLSVKFSYIPQYVFVMIHSHQNGHLSAQPQLFGAMIVPFRECVSSAIFLFFSVSITLGEMVRSQYLVCKRYQMLDTIGEGTCGKVCRDCHHHHHAG